ncbi:MAG: Crp/Fnr family transcriptional regulator [Gemmatimonadota bacterium]|nr:Crp/Fnr family transcriptional regulator [Gemmatimonadota bacterium]
MSTDEDGGDVAEATPVAALRDPAPEHNEVLRRLPHEEYDRLRPHFEVVSLVSMQVINEPGSEIENVYFPQDAVISYVTMLQGSAGVEAHTVGRDGMAGFCLINGVSNSTAQMICQIPGEAKRMSAAAFRDILPECPDLTARLRRYAQLVMELVSQSAACNRMHVTEERCARWLLMSHDRTGRDRFHLTQGFLAQMLGVRRPGVTVAIGMLEKAGFISHQRGVIAVLDRDGLERSSCECYDVIRRREIELIGMHS